MPAASARPTVHHEASPSSISHLRQAGIRVIIFRHAAYKQTEESVQGDDVTVPQCRIKAKAIDEGVSPQPARRWRELEGCVSNDYRWVEGRRPGDGYRQLEARHSTEDYDTTNHGVSGPLSRPDFAGASTMDFPRTVKRCRHTGQDMLNFISWQPRHHRGCSRKKSLFTTPRPVTHGYAAS